MIVIVDSGGANLVSVSSAITRLGYSVSISSKIEEMEAASHLILPGVGSAQRVMERLRDLDLVDFLKGLTKPVLGICVGMQILFESSEEGAAECLGILKGRVKKLVPSPTYCLPHMGWNTLKIRGQSSLMQGIAEDAYVYFVHQFAAPLSEETLATAEYGSCFSAVVQQQNFMGVQFHPELSGGVGGQLLKNFLEQSL